MIAMFVIISVLCLVYGIVVCMGHVGGINKIWSKNVREEDKKKFGLFMGSGLIVIAITMALAILAVRNEDVKLFIYITVIGLLISILLFAVGILLYNTNIFRK